MTVAFDAATTNTTTSFTHTPVGTPRAVILLSVVEANLITAVTYGGVAMSEVALSPVVKTTGEPAQVGAWFLGSSIPTGAQTVAITKTGEGSRVSVITLTGADDTEVVDTTSISSDSVTDPSATLSLGGRDCFCCQAGRSGQDAVGGVTPLTGWTELTEADLGTQIAFTHRYNTVGTTDVTMGWTQLAEDATAIGVAASEVVAGGAALSIAPLIQNYRNMGLMH